MSSSMRRTKLCRHSFWCVQLLRVLSMNGLAPGHFAQLMQKYQSFAHFTEMWMDTILTIIGQLLTCVRRKCLLLFFFFFNYFLSLILLPAQFVSAKIFRTLWPSGVIKCSCDADTLAAMRENAPKISMRTFSIDTNVLQMCCHFFFFLLWLSKELFFSCGFIVNASAIRLVHTNGFSNDLHHSSDLLNHIFTLFRFDCFKDVLTNCTSPKEKTHSSVRHLSFCLVHLERAHWKWSNTKKKKKTLRSYHFAFAKNVSWHIFSSSKL